MSNAPDRSLAASRPNVTDITHLGTVCADCPPIFETLCGAPIQGIEVQGEVLDCLVCAEIANQPCYCKTCGAPMEGW